ncbi:radical SAM peptide maturase, CXXX-repeat target family [Thiospirochaeta perfilievii]|uniref:Radical SAM peptide maturase, CXXX-repeat target family n=1 Tax=Thiospirochaeta perfilievii TaxID=252967 RepID=A0A5C1QBW0_9SPIO|nr:radical SAM peptide maturase, CXXX-repeat target family [Thiospirochaeta perfilievii]QEN04144.1 radical SAM peptide maturase, CXXX-repeat target family [Thiospirochaeta perfilievii]
MVLGNGGAQSWKGGNALNVTFVVTNDCNLICNYCYVCNRDEILRMPFNVAKDAVDYIINNSDKFDFDSVMFDFIGGEPFIEIDLISKLCDYIKNKLYVEKHRWFGNFQFSISTNGLLYKTDKVQKFIKSNKEILGIGFSIDGNKDKHDLQRIYKNGKGSYDDVMSNFDLYRSQFPGIQSTKATFSHEDLVYLKDSILSLWENGIEEVNSNIVYEDVWVEGDPEIFEKQLKELADTIIEKELYNNFECTFFDPSLGRPLNGRNNNWCSCGDNMIAVDYKGDFFPCNRFTSATLSNKKERIIGNIKTGIDANKRRAYRALTSSHQSQSKCLECDIASGCSWCQGYNYDESATGTIFHRATYICKMHEARVSANNYFWSQLALKKSIDKGILRGRSKHLYIMLSNNVIEHCSYSSDDVLTRSIDPEILIEAFEFAKNNNFCPIILSPKTGVSNELQPILAQNLFYEISNEGKESNKIIVLSNETENEYQNTIIHLDKSNIVGLGTKIIDLLQVSTRVNIIVKDFSTMNNQDFILYENELLSVVPFLSSQFNNRRFLKEVNVITDRLMINNMSNCKAGDKSLTVSPEGNIFPCAAFYFDNAIGIMGNVKTGLTDNNLDRYKLHSSSLCENCTAYHCKRCIYDNIKNTSEITVPTQEQCELSYREMNVSRILKENIDNKFIDNKLSEIKFNDSLDPLDKLLTTVKLVRN